MGLIQPLDPQKAPHEIKETFDFFQKTIGTVPAPMAMFSVSPDLFKIQVQALHYFMRHPTLSFPLLSSIRYLVSKAYGYQFCTGFNEGFLKKQGLSSEDIQKMAADPASAPLDDKDRAMLSFVMKAIKSPDAVSEADMQGLKTLGWSERDALDAMAHAANMVSASILMKTFKLDMAC